MSDTEQIQNNSQLIIGYTTIYGKETIGIFSPKSNIFHYLDFNAFGGEHINCIKSMLKSDIINLYSIVDGSKANIEFILLSIYGYNKDSINNCVKVILKEVENKIYLLLDKSKIAKLENSFVVRDEKYALKINSYNVKNQKYEVINIYGYICGKGFVGGNGFLNKQKLKDIELFIEVEQLKQEIEVTVDDLLIIANNFAANSKKYVLKK